MSGRALILRRDDWWLFVLRGVAAIAFGGTAVIWPDLTAALLFLLFGAYAFLDGTFMAITAMRRRSRAVERAVWDLVEGISGIVIGILVFMLPELATIALVAVIAAWAIVTGFAEVVMGFGLPERVHAEWLHIFAGAGSIAFGVTVALFPALGLLALAWLVGAYAALFGLAHLALGVGLRSVRR